MTLIEHYPQQLQNVSFEVHMTHSLKVSHVLGHTAKTQQISKD